MEQILFNDFSPQLKLVLDGAALANPLQTKSSQSKKSKLNDDNVLDMSAAYLGPQIWNEMMMSDDLKLEPVDLKLEPVDLDNLLLEDISADLEKDVINDLTTLPNGCHTSISPSLTPKPVGGENELFMYGNTGTPTLEGTLPPYLPSQNDFAFEVGTTNSNSPTLAPPQANEKPAEQPQDADGAGPLQSNYRPSLTDVMISTPTNGLDEPTELFDPSKRSFTDEELKPQPIIRKARKSYVASDCKDTKYWQKREKNNMAAKRSREARRIKENQIAMRANFLEKENSALRQEVQQLRKELVNLMKAVKSQH